ncbi:MAG: hypothetical protein ACYC69_12415 [Thermodesulfovibrionales bacterium]
MYKCEFCSTEIKHSVLSGFNGVLFSKRTCTIYDNPKDFIRAGEKGHYGIGFLLICKDCYKPAQDNFKIKLSEFIRNIEEPIRIKKAAEEALRKSEAEKYKKLHEKLAEEKLHKQEEKLHKEVEERIRILNLPKLINCPDCEKEISRRAVVCPHCGAPNSEPAGASIHHIDGATPPSTPRSTADIPKCPTCHSLYVEKISLASKAGNVALVGVFAIGKISKTFKCNSCGYQW